MSNRKAAELAATILEGKYKSYADLSEDDRDLLTDYLLDEMEKYNDEDILNAVETSSRMFQEAARDILFVFLKSPDIPRRALLGKYRAKHPLDESESFKKRPRTDADKSKTMRKINRQQIRLNLVKNLDRLPECQKIGPLQILSLIHI